MTIDPATLLREQGISVTAHHNVKRTNRRDVIYHRQHGTPMLAVGRRHPDELPPDDHQNIELARQRARALRTS